MSGEVSEPVKKCIVIFKNAKSDTETFAALFMVTKLVKAKDCTLASKKAIFEAIGFDFLKRLLLTNDLPIDCPPSMYKSLALSILTVFSNVEELATHRDMLGNLGIFLNIVKQSDENDEDLMAIGEAYNCLKGIASFPKGCKALIDSDCLNKFIEIYSQGSFQSDEALNLIAMIITNLGNKSFNETNIKQFHQLMNKISLDFETDHDKRKFELCNILNILIFNCPKKLVLDSVNNQLWPQIVYKGLTDILQSKIGPQQRNPALILTASILDLLGIDWLNVTDEDLKSKQFFLLLIQLAAIELRMQLDGGKTLKTVMQQKDLLISCFIILELSINFIYTDQIDLDQKEKQTLYTGLKGGFTALINLLIKLMNDKKNLVGEEKLFICAMIRLLAAWLAQETTQMRTQIYQLLPFILEISNETFYAYKSRRVAEKAGTLTEIDPVSQIDILRILLPGLCHLTVEDEARRILLNNHQDKVLCDLIEYHWTIVHYKRPPVPRSERLKQLNQPKPELTKELLDEMENSRTAMISTCNVLMNLTVLETKYVEESQVFNNLLRFIFENLPELKDIPENLVLHGNLAVLGLLLLKQLSKRIKKNDFSICRYIQATIRFLWDAYIIDESNDPTALVVSMAYKEHWMEIMELWFLGMQTMSGVIAQIPWISEFAIESGWAEGIIQTLKKVKIGTLPPNVKSAYEDFLCHLVDANESVVEVLKKAEALRVCRNHRLMELEILWEKYAVPVDIATQVCKSFLKNFRKCPENIAMSLDSWRRLLWKQALGDQYNKYADDIYQLWLTLRYDYLAIGPEIINLLQKLHKSYFIGLITNGTSSSQWEKIDRLNLRKYFDIILVSGDLTWEKPNFQIFHEACNYLGILPKQCLMVGDKLETDILGGIQAKLGGTVWIPLNHNELLNNEINNPDFNPDFIIESVTQLPTLLPKNPKVLSFRNLRNHNNSTKQNNTTQFYYNCEDSNSSDGS